MSFLNVIKTEDSLLLEIQFISDVKSTILSFKKQIKTAPVVDIKLI